MLISIIPAIMLISIMVSLLIFTPILLVDLIDGSFRISETVLWFGNVLAILFMAIGCLIFGILVDRLNPGIVLTFGSLFLAMQVALFFNHLRNGGEYGLIFLPYLDLLQVSLVQFLRLLCDYFLLRFV